MEGHAGRGGGKEIQGSLQGNTGRGEEWIEGRGEGGKEVKGGKIMLLSLPAVRWSCVWETLHPS